MPRDEIAGLERLAAELRDAVSASEWERAAALDARLHEALRCALEARSGAAEPLGEPVVAALGRIMRVYETATRDALVARDRVRDELAGVRAGHRAAAGYLTTARL